MTTRTPSQLSTTAHVRYDLAFDLVLLVVLTRDPLFFLSRACFRFFGFAEAFAEADLAFGLAGAAFFVDAFVEAGLTFDFGFGLAFVADADLAFASDFVFPFPFFLT